MIRTYTVNELEQLAGTSKRTISDYVSKGLLSGPSHRGRGARYPQADLDVLRIVPRLRTLLKGEFPNLKAVGAFLAELSAQDLRRLARRSNERALELEVRRIRVRHSMMAVLPALPPERIDEALEELSPEQIRGIDTGRYQIGAVVDMAGLLRDEESEGQPQLAVAYSRDPASQAANDEQRLTASFNRSPPRVLNSNGNGVAHSANSSGNAESEGGQVREPLNRRMEDLADRLERIERLLLVSP